MHVHPEVAGRDCDECQEFAFDETTGKKQFRDAGELFPVLRGGAPPPCRTGKGCPKGTPEEPRTLSTKNLLAFIHYTECKAVGVFPDDPIVRQNAGIIRSLEDMMDRYRQDNQPLISILKGIANAR